MALLCLLLYVQSRQWLRIYFLKKKKINSTLPNNNVSSEYYVLSLELP